MSALLPKFVFMLLYTAHIVCCRVYDAGAHPNQN